MIIFEKISWRFFFSLFLSIGFIFFVSNASAASVINVDEFDETYQTINEKITQGNSGASTNSFSFQLPPGTNGLQPSLSLNYNSHTTNGLENYAGSGWTLSNSYIERDINYTPDSTSDDIFYLNMGGSKQELVYDSTAGFYKTFVDTFSKIEEATGSASNSQGDYWVVTSSDGTQYRFGHDASSEEVCSDRSYVRRWYVDLITDTNGNDITYTYNETGNYSYLDKIEYNDDKTRVIDLVYDATSSARIGTLNGCRVEQTQRLNSIEVEVDTQLYKEYELSYEANDTLHNILTEVTELDATGSALPSTTFEYYEEDRTWSTTPITSYDDDHNPDISLDYRQTKLIDVNRDNYPDIVWSEIDGSSRRLKVYKSNGSVWSETSETWYNSTTYPEVDFTREDVAFTDVNGDSLPDFIWSKEITGTEVEWYVLPNTGSSWSTSRETWYDSSNDGLLHLEETSVGIYDMDGDGLPELVRTEDFDDNGTTKYRILVYKNDGSSWSDTASTWLTTEYEITLEHAPPDDTDPTQVEYFHSDTRIIDVTNDGLPDIVFSELINSGSNRRWHVFINKGDGFDTSPKNWLEDSDDFALSNRKFTMFDANGDGYVDIVKGEENGTNNLWTVWHNTGNGWSKPKVTYLDDDSDPNLGLDTNNVAAADVNGDGLTDLVSTDKGTGSQRIWKVTENDGYAPNRLKKINNSTGGSTSVSYTTSSSSDNTGADTLSDLPFPMWLVTQSTQNNGMSGTHQRIFTINFSYEGGLYDFDEREVRGFAEVLANDSTTKTLRKFHQGKRRQGLEYESTQSDQSDNLYLKTEQTWSDTSEAAGNYTVFLTSTKQSKYDNETTPFVTEIGYTYDTYGNLFRVVDKGDISDSTDDRITETEYIHNTTDWLISYPGHTYQWDYNENTLSESWFLYDGNTSWMNGTGSKGNLTKRIDWHNNGSDPVTTFTYDSYGNQLTVTDPEGNVTTTAFGTNDTTYTYPDSITNDLSQETEFTYEFETGNLLTITDSNGYVTTYTYDTFGRPLKEIKPYDSSSDPTTTYSYLLDGNAPELLVTEQLLEASTSASIKTYQVIDGYGQTIQTKSDAEDSSKQVNVDIFYDSRGNNAGQSNPYLVTKSSSYSTPDTNKPKTTISYDLLNRATTLQNPDLTSRTTDYDRDVITYTDENGNQISHTLNGFGEIELIEETKDNDIYETEYIYDAKGNLTRITDDQDNDILFTYDSLNRQTGLTDPDLGTWLYYYDLNGNVKATIDNRGIVVYSSYDDLNRLTKTDYPNDPDITYTYDTNVDGTLAQASTTDYTITYDYDQRLREVSKTTSIDGFSWTNAMAYNSADQVTWHTYPDDQAIEYTYNDQGMVDSVGYAVSDIDYNATGKIASKDYVNGLTTTYTYDSDTTRLTQQQTGTLQNLTYGYDNVGNVTSFEDSVTGLDKTFTYDDLNRLTSADDPMGNDYDYDYDSLGNMISMDFNDQTYQFEYGTVAGPHALSTGNFTSPLGHTLPAFSQSQVEPSYGHYFSFDTSDTLGSISVTPKDIARYDDNTSTWYMYFDGSDVSVDQDIDAFHILNDGTILMSFLATIDLGWGDVDDQDIVRFIPTQVGDTTEGTFEFYFDASNVGVGGVFDETDAITVTGNGDLLISTNTDDTVDKFIAEGLRHVTEGSFEGFFETPNGDAVTASWFNYENNRMYYADDDDTDLHYCTVDLTGTSPECSSLTDVSTSGWGIGETITGYHYYSGSSSNDIANEPDLIEGIYLSHDTATVTIDSVDYKDEDVAFYDIQTNTWSMYIDGSDIGVSEIDAFHIMDDGKILLSFGGSETFSFGTAADEDVVKFTPTSLGDTTSGSFEMYFDGSDIGMTDTLTGVSEDPEGNLLITIDDSQGGSPVWGDIYVTYRFDATSYGSTTAGTLERYFEGDDVNISSGYSGIQSLPSGNFYMVPQTSVKVKKTEATGETDILRCQILDIGDNTHCQFGILIAPEFARDNGDIDALGLKLLEEGS